ncbi:MAG: metallophosphoesterase [Planctomycetes bacterium]|nr:metallophosphoesterase [Planctomycetota bacterium]
MIPRKAAWVGCAAAAFAACVALAHADEAPEIAGDWHSSGREFAAGAFTADVAIAAAEGRHYTVAGAGRYRRGDQPYTVAGDGVRSGKTFRLTRTVAVGAADRLGDLHAAAAAGDGKRVRAVYTISGDGDRMTGVLYAVAGGFGGYETLTKTRAARASRIVKGPYLQNLERDAITVLWETDGAGPSRVDFGTSAALGQTVEDARPVTLHEVRLAGLPPDTTHHYRVATGTVASATFSFRSAKPRGAPFRFVAYGDSRTSLGMHRKVARDIGASDPAFILTVGDLVEDGNNYDLWQQDFFDPLRDVISRIPIFTTLGNHERHSNNYFNFFALPGNESWYSFDYGDAHFICLDSNSPYEAGTEQYRWLEADLAAAAAATWKFVWFHHPVFSSGQHGDTDRAKTLLVPLFERHHVDVVWNGHDHDYERNFKDGIYYVVTGGGGVPLYPRTVSHAHWSFWRANRYSQVFKGLLEGAWHHCVVEVNGRTLTMRVVRVGGGELDSVSITK